MPAYDPSLFVDGRYRPELAGAYPGNPEEFGFDSERVAGGVARYYGGVSSSLPTFDPIQRNIAGRVSPEELRLVGQRAAERGIGIGSYGGGNDETAYLRATGTTSRALTNLGIEQYGQQMSTIPGLSPDSLFINPTNLASMNLQWAQSQAEQAAALERQQAGDRAALERSNVGQQTSLGVARIGQRNQPRSRGALMLLTSIK